jgi:hypothetical protein
MRSAGAKKRSVTVTGMPIRMRTAADMITLTTMTTGTIITTIITTTTGTTIPTTVTLTTMVTAIIISILTG